MSFLGLTPLYVKFDGSRKFAKTQEVNCDKSGVITVDLDLDGGVIGIEAIGIGEVTLNTLLQRAHVQAPDVDLSKARFGALEEALA
ncbi:MAG: hypothetical protein PHD76_02385 [Methylacidiphilales bacterium]|nr:hypothetical protein [Candidatus Methylacidiphilales bacterium]